MDGVDALGTAEAARLLAVSPQRVRALWHQGALSGRLVANRLLLDRTSVLEAAERDRPATRPLSARNAWTLLAMLAAVPAPWASAPERSRLRAVLLARDQREIARLVRARARTLRFAGAASAGRYVLADRDVVAAGATLAHRWTDLVVDDVTEGYTSASHVDRLAQRLHLWRDPGGQIVLHAVPDALAGVVGDRDGMPPPVVAVDLLESSDPRSQRAGERLWREAVRRWRATAKRPGAGRGAGR